MISKLSKLIFLTGSLLFLAGCSSAQRDPIDLARDPQLVGAALRSDKHLGVQVLSGTKGAGNLNWNDPGWHYDVLCSQGGGYFQAKVWLSADGRRYHVFSYERRNLEQEHLEKLMTIGVLATLIGGPCVYGLSFAFGRAARPQKS